MHWPEPSAKVSGNRRRPEASGLKRQPDDPGGRGYGAALGQRGICRPGLSVRRIFGAPESAGRRPGRRRAGGPPGGSDVREKTVTATDGTRVPIQADSVCVHGDGPKALAFVQNIRKRLKKREFPSALFEKRKENANTRSRVIPKTQKVFYNGGTGYCKNL